MLQTFYIKWLPLFPDQIKRCVSFWKSKSLKSESPSWDLRWLKSGVKFPKGYSMNANDKMLKNDSFGFVFILSTTSAVTTATLTWRWLWTWCATRTAPRGTWSSCVRWPSSTENMSGETRRPRETAPMTLITRLPESGFPRSWNFWKSFEIRKLNFQYWKCFGIEQILV